MRRVRPHLLELAEKDAQQFMFSQQIKANPSDDPYSPDPKDCLTSQIQHLYDNLADLVRQRHDIPPDVEDDAGFVAQLRPDAQKELGFDPRAPRVVTPAQAMKRGCTKYTAEAAEVYCRCVVDAAVVGGLPEGEMRALGAGWDNRALQQAGDRYPKFAAYKRDCLH